LNVSAKDKATGKEQSIVIKASSGLSDDEIDNMVKDAELHAEDDKKFHELIGARNSADTLVHATTKAMEDLGDKLEADEKTTIEAAVKDLEEAIKGDDIADIEAKTSALGEASSKMAERAYAEQQSAGGDADASSTADDAGSNKANDDNVVDADFEEVDDKK